MPSAITSRKRGAQIARTVTAATLAVVAATAAAPVAAPAAAAGPERAPTGTTIAATDAAPITVRGTGFVDRYGREVVLRGFNVSGTTKLSEHGGLPFANVSDARRSAAALRALTGANAVRFLLSWAAAEPTPGRLDQDYVQRATEQIRAFLDQGMYVLVDYHQDLFSRYLFNADSWYTGDGAPQWVVAAGGYPQESCGVCFFWGQNYKQNRAVQDAMYDFWHNRTLSTSAGPMGVQDAFLRQTEATLRHIRTHLTAAEFDRVVGLDPLNEPYAGRYDAGQDSRSWERDLLMPFYRKIRERMDAAGWQDKPAFIEPNMFWDGNVDFARETGGFLDAGVLGPRYVFNSHYYDHQAISGVLMWGKATDGRYTTDINHIRERSGALGTAAIVTEFGHPTTGYTSDKMPTVVKGQYQSLDSAVRGADWWAAPGRSGPVLSATQWQWDIYNGRHSEPMNGNPDKVQTEGDAWNGEDFSLVHLDENGTPRLRVDERLVDRVYPAAVAGRTLAFAYEDRARDGGTVLTWNRVPSSMPRLAELVGAGQYAVLVWRSSGGDVPTEVRLPASFTPATTTVVTDLPAEGTRFAESGSQLLLTAPSEPGGLHFALVTNGRQGASAELVAAAQQELSRWAAAAF